VADAARQRADGNFPSCPEGMIERVPSGQRKHNGRSEERCDDKTGRIANRNI